MTTNEPAIAASGRAAAGLWWADPLAALVIVCQGRVPGTGRLVVLAGRPGAGDDEPGADPAFPLQPGQRPVDRAVGDMAGSDGAGIAFGLIAIEAKGRRRRSRQPRRQ